MYKCVSSTAVLPESTAQVTATTTGFSLRSCRYVKKKKDQKKSPGNDEQTKAHAEYIQCFLCYAHLSANTPPHPKQQIKYTAKGGNENQALWSGDKSKIEPLILFFFLPRLIHERHIPLNPTQGCSRRAFTSSHNARSCEGLLK